MTNIKKIFVVCSLVLSLLVTSSCGQEAISQNERNESSSTTSNLTEDSSNSKKFALAEIIVAEKTDKGTIRLSYMTNTISEDDTDSLFNNDYETDEDIKEGTYYKRTEYSDASSWNNAKDELKNFAESANAEDIVKKTTAENFEYTPFGEMTTDDSNNDSSEPDTTKTSKDSSEKDSSSEGDKTTTTTKKTSDSSSGETTKTTTTTKKAETTTQYVYIPPTTTKTTKTTTKAATTTTTKATQPASYIGKCQFCGKNITANDGVYQGEFYICNTCKGSKCLLCGKACNSSIGKQQSDRYIGTHWFCYTCRPDLKPSSQPNITGTDADARREAQTVVTLTNKLRASKGLSQLKTDSRLTEAAMARAKELEIKFAHSRPNGTTGTSIVNEYISNASTNGENIMMNQATGYDDGSYIYSCWENSTGHYNTMLRANNTYIGVGVYYVYKNGYKYTYSVQLFCTVI